MNGGYHCPFPIDKRHILSSSYYYWREARHRLSLQFQVMSKYLLRQTQKRKNLALSLLTGTEEETHEVLEGVGAKI